LSAGIRESTIAPGTGEPCRELEARRALSGAPGTESAGNKRERGLQRQADRAATADPCTCRAGWALPCSGIQFALAGDLPAALHGGRTLEDPFRANRTSQAPAKTRAAAIAGGTRLAVRRCRELDSARDSRARSAFGQCLGRPAWGVGVPFDEAGRCSPKLSRRRRAAAR